MINCCHLCRLFFHLPLVSQLTLSLSVFSLPLFIALNTGESCSAQGTEPQNTGMDWSSIGNSLYGVNEIGEDAKEKMAFLINKWKKCCFGGKRQTLYKYSPMLCFVVFISTLSNFFPCCWTKKSPHGDQQNLIFYLILSFVLSYPSCVSGCLLLLMHWSNIKTAQLHGCHPNNSYINIQRGWIIGGIN